MTPIEGLVFGALVTSALLVLALAEECQFHNFFASTSDAASLPAYLTGPFASFTPDSPCTSDHVLWCVQQLSGSPLEIQSCLIVPSDPRNLTRCSTPTKMSGTFATGTLTHFGTNNTALWQNSTVLRALTDGPALFGGWTTTNDAELFATLCGVTTPQPRAPRAHRTHRTWQAPVHRAAAAPLLPVSTQIVGSVAGVFSPSLSTFLPMAPPLTQFGWCYAVFGVKPRAFEWQACLSAFRVGPNSTTCSAWIGAQPAGSGTLMLPASTPLVPNADILTIKLRLADVRESPFSLVSLLGNQTVLETYCPHPNRARFV